MNEVNVVNRTVINRDSLPHFFPTHGHDAHFWECVGRTVATFGFLEEVLGKAIFAFTATRQYSPDDIEAAYEAWLPQLERALTDQLWNLAETFGQVAKDHPDTSTQNIADLVQDIKEASKIRNVLCHGSWRLPNADGAAVPFFVNRQKEVFDTAIDTVRLMQIQTHVSQLACSVVDTVTHMGWQFPGSAGWGRPIVGRG